ncbi:MAG: 30S ribosomal protein S1 [Selenomonadaceae bacterium]|nr:30S ribosomal protein S1 [Selenomonadaceae bacterium]MBR1858699.1 30S ribosomal protein S1 [Selenomonadaceae bacterium]
MGALLEEAGDMENIREHEVVEGTVVQVNRNEAFVDIGYKQEIPVPKRELAYPEPESAEDVVKVGDKIDVYIQSLGGENGGALSKVKADRMVAWKEMEAVKERGEAIEAKITQVVKGGLVASVNGLRGFIPASQMELHFVKDLNVYVGQTFKVTPLEIDVHKQRLVLSRRQILEDERVKKQDEIFATLEAGQTVKGVVKRLVDYGAFIDIGGVDGLAHISDLSWERVKQPSDVIKVGDEIDVYVKNVDSDSRRISLSIKDTLRDPWLDKADKYKEGDLIEGKIIKLTDFGAFMEIEPGFDGLIPMGELSDRRIERADEAVHVNDVVKVKIMRIDVKRKRISLSINRAKREADAAIVKSYQAEQAKK